ncbi:pyruvate kinase [Thalassoglobus sp. JC818]|uniref:pyruvate kinase n=1 Tax=Thalassoglobus sp. JC818 TaxID=3232136 RepID=UPI00345A6E56
MTQYLEPVLTKTKIVATVGPASQDRDRLHKLILSGVDIFRLNFAHGRYDVMADVVKSIRELSAELKRSIGILGDLAGPKLRLGELPDEGLALQAGELCYFAREIPSSDPNILTTTYPGMIDDLQVGNQILMADGIVSVRVVEKEPDRIVCEVEQPGRIFSRQGVNLPGSQLQLSSLTPKDLDDLQWGLENRLDFISLSFVRRAADVAGLRERIEKFSPDFRPLIVAKIEKPEAVDDLENILSETDVVMVARGDLGVEVDIVRVPALQKRIIKECNRRRVPVITATQMLESMQQNELPTRAEATDVANAVLDGTDAVMLSAETAVGRHPSRVVSMMSRITREIEPLVPSNKDLPMGRSSRNPATELTKAVTLGAIHAAEEIRANLIFVLTRSGKTAFAISEIRSPVPIVALTDDPQTARWLSVAWGVHTVVTDIGHETPTQMRDFAIGWGMSEGLLHSGDRIAIVGTTDWSDVGKNLMMVHAVP